MPDLSPWQLPSPNTANFALDLPPPHPSFRNNARGRTQSLSTWQNYALAGPSSIPASFTPPDAPTSSNESTPALHPPGTPLLPVGVSTPGMTLDTEDKRQRNTLACECIFVTLQALSLTTFLLLINLSPFVLSLAACVSLYVDSCQIPSQEEKAHVEYLATDR